ncbi:MAG: hypothetical protein ACLQVJ_10430 [Syntrophobacteraceae bacterium]
MISQTKGMLEKELNCAGPVAAYTIAKFGADDNTATTATSTSDSFLGIFQFATNAAGQPVRLMMDGIGRVAISQAVTRGQWVTTDAYGNGVPANPAPGANCNVIGKAMNSGNPGQVVAVLINPCQIQG